MFNAARSFETCTSFDPCGEVVPSSFRANVPAHVIYRRLLATFDDDQLKALESDINRFVESGRMSASLAGMLTAATLAD